MNPIFPVIKIFNLILISLYKKNIFITYFSCSKKANSMNTNLYKHEVSYTRKNLISVIHNSRLKTILNIFKKHIDQDSLSWIDFGCSNGFIIDQIQKRSKIKFSEIKGLDHSKDLIDLAVNKNIPNTNFALYDLNTVDSSNLEFDIVSCFETLEHVGSVKNAFKNLYNHLKPNGTLIITVPNEIGLIGLIKFAGRYFVRKNPYKDFFNSKSWLNYCFDLITKKDIYKYRDKNKKVHGPHLGFDYRQLENFIIDEYVNTNKIKFVKKYLTIFNSNVVYILKRIQ